MHRRDFLISAASLAAVAAIGVRPARGSAPAGSATGLRFALKYGMIDAGATVLEKFRIAKDAGFDGVELDSPSTLSVDEALAAKAATGLEIPGVVDSVHWNQPLSSGDAAIRAAGVAALEAALHDAAALGATQVLLVPGVVNAEASYADAMRRAGEAIAGVVPLAERLSVSIAIENVWNNMLLSPLEAAATVDTWANGRTVTNAEGTRPVVGWYFDVGNIWHYGWPQHWLDALGPDRVLRLDIKGYSRAKADKEGKWAGFAVEIDDGDVPWESVRAWIARTGWSGWATAEVAGGDAGRLRDIRQRMQRVLVG